MIHCDKQDLRKKPKNEVIDKLFDAYGENEKRGCDPL